jgi:regulator of replication initiation timing
MMEEIYKKLNDLKIEHEKLKSERTKLLKEKVELLEENRRLRIQLDELEEKSRGPYHDH